MQKLLGRGLNHQKALELEMFVMKVFLTIHISYGFETVFILNLKRLIQLLGLYFHLFTFSALMLYD